MKKITVKYLGFTGTGNTRKEAKADASRQLHAFVRDAEFGPIIIMVGIVVVVISRTWDQWQYQLVGGGFSHDCRHLGHKTKELAERSARLHVAQMLCSVPDNARFDLILNEEDRQEHESWSRWQCRHKEAIDAGLGDEAAREYASGAGQLKDSRDTQGRRSREKHFESAA